MSTIRTEAKSSVEQFNEKTGRMEVIVTEVSSDTMAAPILAPPKPETTSAPVVQQVVERGVRSGEVSVELRNARGEISGYVSKRVVESLHPVEVQHANIDAPVVTLRTDAPQAEPKKAVEHKEPWTIGTDKGIHGDNPKSRTDLNTSPLSVSVSDPSTKRTDN